MNVCQMLLFFLQITPKITCFPCKFTYCWAKISFSFPNLSTAAKKKFVKEKVAGAGKRMDYVFIHLRRMVKRRIILIAAILWEERSEEYGSWYFSTISIRLDSCLRMLNIFRDLSEWPLVRNECKSCKKVQGLQPGRQGTLWTLRTWQVHRGAAR